MWGVYARVAGGGGETEKDLTRSLRERFSLFPRFLRALPDQKSICMFSRTYLAGSIAVGVSQMLPCVAVGAL
jgi:hypothetical protein